MLQYHKHTFEQLSCRENQIKRHIKIQILLHHKTQNPTKKDQLQY